jgi:O-antigen/teichoic acid export membrane protein
LSRSISTYVISDASNRTDSRPEEVFALLRVSMLFSFIALFMLYLLPGETYAVIFGKQFRHIKYSVRFLFPGIWMYSMVFVLEAWLLGKGRTGLLIAANAVGAILSALLCLLLIPRFVMSGAGLAATVAFTFTGMLLFFGFCRINRLSPLAIFDWSADVDIFRERWNRWRGRIG